MAEATSPAKPTRTVCRAEPECQVDLPDDTMQACGFSDQYIQSKDVGSRVLGHGGSSASIERCFSAETGEEFAVKRLTSVHEEKFPYLAQNEMQGLLRANGHNNPRVVKLIESFRPPAGGVYLILECVYGRSLGDCLDLLPVGDSIDMAAQMLQTVYWLHMDSRVVHLDITSSNIMLRSPEDGNRNRDELRLLDFGFAQLCSKDAQAADIEPQGATAPCAAPELLRSLQLQYEGARSRQPGVLINGCAADWWALGVVLYELLIGELPFKTHAGPASTDSLTSADSSAALNYAAAPLIGSAASVGSSSLGGVAFTEVPESVLPREGLLTVWLLRWSAKKKQRHAHQNPMRHSGLGDMVATMQAKQDVAGHS